jgi:hypothetical protein
MIQRKCSFVFRLSRPATSRSIEDPLSRFRPRQNLLASLTLVPAGKTLAEEGFVDLDGLEARVVEADVVAAGLQLAARSDASKDHGARKELRTAGRTIIVVLKCRSVIC